MNGLLIQEWYLNNDNVEKSNSNSSHKKRNIVYSNKSIKDESESKVPIKMPIIAMGTSSAYSE